MKERSGYLMTEFKNNVNDTERVKKIYCYYGPSIIIYR